MASLSKRLIDSAPDALCLATEHTFLSKAVNSTLSDEGIKHWLGQDRLYAYSYVQFISAILSKVSIPTKNKLGDSLQGRYVNTLIDCLTNIQREINLFEEIAESEGWRDDILAAKSTSQTRAYQDLFAGAAAAHRPLLISVVTLFATEHCYYTAWSRTAALASNHKENGKLNVIQRVFIPNWTNSEFKSFVNNIGQLLDDLAAQEDPDGQLKDEVELAWTQVLWAEKNFWPDV